MSIIDQRNTDEIFEDAKRYLLLSVLVEQGLWAISEFEITDNYGSTVTTFMDDKAEMDKRLDKLRALNDNE